MAEALREKLASSCLPWDFFGVPSFCLNRALRNSSLAFLAVSMTQELFISFSLPAPPVT